MTRMPAAFDNASWRGVASTTAGRVSRETKKRPLLSDAGRRCSEAAQAGAFLRSGTAAALLLFASLLETYGSEAQMTGPALADEIAMHKISGEAVSSLPLRPTEQSLERGIELVSIPQPESSAFFGREHKYAQIYVENSAKYQRQGIEVRTKLSMDRPGFLAMTRQEGVRVGASRNPFGCPEGTVLAIDVYNMQTSALVPCNEYAATEISKPPEALRELWLAAGEEAKKRLGSGRLFWWVLYSPELRNALRGLVWDRVGDSLQPGERVVLMFTLAKDGFVDALVFRAGQYVRPSEPPVPLVPPVHIGWSKERQPRAQGVVEVVCVVYQGLMDDGPRCNDARGVEGRWLLHNDAQRAAKDSKFSAGSVDGEIKKWSVRMRFRFGREKIEVIEVVPLRPIL